MNLTINLKVNKTYVRSVASWSESSASGARIARYSAQRASYGKITRFFQIPNRYKRRCIVTIKIFTQQLLHYLFPVLSLCILNGTKRVLTNVNDEGFDRNLTGVAWFSFFFQFILKFDIKRLRCLSESVLILYISNLFILILILQNILLLLLLLVKSLNAFRELEILKKQKTELFECCTGKFSSFSKIRCRELSNIDITMLDTFKNFKIECSLTEGLKRAYLWN